MTPQENLLEEPFDRLVKSSLVNQAYGDTVDAGRDCGIQGVDHVSGDRLFRPSPLIRTTQERPGIFCTVPGRNKERVRGDVVDEREFPLWVFWKSAEGLTLTAASALVAMPSPRENNDNSAPAPAARRNASRRESHTSSRAMSKV